MSAPAVEEGDLVRVRGQQWVVSQVQASALPIDELSSSPATGRTLVTLTSVSEDDLGEELAVIWEVEPGRTVIPAGELPTPPEPCRWDSPQDLGALLDAVRWGTVASADVTTLQAPFRAGIVVKDFQLEPVAKALRMPRIGLLIADDVGLGKTIEAGLVMQELLLRHRARRMIVVCPAPLTLKWREEMASRFGLDFVILDTAALKELRRTHGLQANPFTVHPRMIISLPWLRTPRVQRLLDEVLDDSARHPGFFDLLVVDEAHHVAPPAPQRGGYAVDSQQTRAVRRLSEFSQHRMLLSATPHNGYAESWQALLEMVDPRRFARGVKPDPDAVAEVLVRRLKDEVVDADGRPEFARRLPAVALEVDYTAAEVEGHQRLATYTALRRGSPQRNDLVSLLLKKRLFSSPAAFAATVEQHVRTVAGRTAEHDDDDALDVDYDWDDEPDDAAGSEAEDALLIGAATSLTREAQVALDDVRRWAAAHLGPADSKAERLVAELRATCCPGGVWTTERIVVFTEYRATQVWLAGLLNARGLGGSHLGLLHGGMATQERERLKAAFQAAPERDDVRILLATDAASEGIDLQQHCCRIVNYDIPFNPNRLEQRIGRVDRFGQTRDVHVTHFVGSGWRDAAPGSIDDDLEFLRRVADKVAQERADLGRVNPVLAAGVEAQMLGRKVAEDTFAVQASPVSALRMEQDLRDQVARLRAQLDASTTTLHVAPPNLRRVVDAALRLAGQPPLTQVSNGIFAAPRLSRGWERLVSELADPLTPELQRPLTFDPLLSQPSDGAIVQQHLGSPLVAQSQRLLRSVIWGESRRLSRVAGVQVVLPTSLPDVLRPGELLACVLTRLLVVGADGGRLHEEVMLMGRALPVEGRSRRLDLEERRFDELRTTIERALDPDRCEPVDPAVAERLTQAWPDLVPLLMADIAQRAEQRRATLERELGQRRRDEEGRARGVASHLRRTLTDALDTQLSFEDLQRYESAGQRQVELDRVAWRARLDDLDDALAREVEMIRRRYDTTRSLTFPVAVVLAQPVGVSLEAGA